MKRTLFEELKRDLADREISFRQVVSIVILTLIVTVFVFFGYNNMEQVGMGSALEVDSTSISIAEYQREWTRVDGMYAQFRQALGSSSQQKEFIKNQVIDSLVTQEMTHRVTKQLGIQVTPEEIVQVIIQDFPVFQDKGRFQRDRYEGVLKANQLKPADFERQIAKEKAYKRALLMFEIALQPTSQETLLEGKLEKLKKNVDYVSWDANEIIKKQSIPLSKTMERLKDDQFLKQVQDEFEQKKGNLGQKEQVKARHILIKTEPGNADSESKALAKIKDIQTRIQKEDFAQLAKELSQDEGSKAQGGDLGFFARGAMVPEFEKAAFSLNINQVSEPIKTNFGYHLIQVLDKKAETPAKLEDHQTTIAQEIIGRELYEIELKKLEEALKNKDVKIIEGQLAQWKLKWQESGWFSLGDERGGSLTSAVATEKAWELSSSQSISSQLVRDGGTVYILKFKGDKSEETKSDAATLAQQIKQNRASDVLMRLVQELKKTAQIKQSPQLN